MDRRTLLLGFLALLLVPVAQAQETDSPHSRDALLDQLVGEWTMTGHVAGDSVRYDARARRVLDGQFVQLQMTDVQAPPEYAAHVYIGYDSTRSQYVAHWLDTSGPQSSTTLGYGRREEDALIFQFDYPDAPFRTTFERRRDGTWQVRMRSKTQSDDWQPFAEFEMHRH